MIIPDSWISDWFPIPKPGCKFKKNITVSSIFSTRVKKQLTRLCGLRWQGWSADRRRASRVPCVRRWTQRECLQAQTGGRADGGGSVGRCGVWSVVAVTALATPYVQSVASSVEDAPPHETSCLLTSTQTTQHCSIVDSLLLNHLGTAHLLKNGHTVRKCKESVFGAI